MFTPSREQWPSHKGTGGVMFCRHLKTIGLAVALLVAASSIHNIATAATAMHPVAAPTHAEHYRVSISSAEASIAAGASLRSISIGY